MCVCVRVCVYVCVYVCVCINHAEKYVNKLNKAKRGKRSILRGIKGFNNPSMLIYSLVTAVTIKYDM